MKLLTFYTDEDKKMYKNFFLRSFNEILRNNISISSKYFDESENLVVDKINYIIENIDVDSDEILIFCSCDTQFFRDFHDQVEEELENYDIKFQDNVSDMSSDFFVFRQNEETLNFFNTVLQLINKSVEAGNEIISDQEIFNALIKKDKHSKIGVLPKNRYYNIAVSTGAKAWEGDINFEVPNSIAMHQASWTKGVDNKIKLLRLVKNKVLNNVYR